eukprot:gene12298-12434_t
MQLASAYPDVSRSLTLIKPVSDVAAYLNDSGTVCTSFLPTNAAFQESLQRLKQFVGLAAGNVSLQRSTFNYHIIPGKALTAADLMRLNSTTTRANETLYIWHKK